MVPKYAEAEAELTQAARLDPANARQYYFNFGAILVNSGREAAANGFHMAIEAAPDDPRNAESYYQYALCLTQQATLAPDGKSCRLRQRWNSSANTGNSRPMGQT